MSMQQFTKIALVLGLALLLQSAAATAQPPPPWGGPPPGGPGNALLQVFDTDHDGTLSAAEIDAAAAKLRERDANHDGKLTAEEIRPMFRGEGRGRGRGGPGFGPGPGAPGFGEGSSLQKASLPKDEGEKKILDAIESARRGERYANVSTADGRLMRQLTEALGAKRVVELGTSTGESGLWFSLALRKTGGKLYTYDIDPERISVARENFKKAGVLDLVVITEGDAHETAIKDREPIDILFIDAEKEGYDAYLRELLPLVRPGGLILAHNMARPVPNPRYIEAITTNPDLDSSFVLMDAAGLGITLKKR